MFIPILINSIKYAMAHRSWLFISIFMVLISLNSNAFSANDSTQLSLPTAMPTVIARDQYLLVNSQKPTSTFASTGSSNSNVTITCATNEQLVGLIESNTGAGGNPGPQPFPRSNTAVGNYTFVPHCTNPSVGNGACTRDWVMEYTQIDTLQLICAQNSFSWENLNEHTNPDTPTVVIGAYVAPAP